MEKTLVTKTGTFIIRPYTEDDEEKVMDLWEAAFLHKIDKKVWRWKFSNATFDRQIMLSVNEEGLPVAMYAGIAFDANYKGTDIKMTQLIDNMTHPDYRQSTSGRKGLFVQTGEYFFKKYANKSNSILQYGFPGKIAYRLGKLLLKYTSIDDYGAYLSAEVKNIKPSSFLNFGYVQKVDSASSGFDHLWESAKIHYPLLVKRNRAFIQWRFFENPIHKYTIYTYKNFMGKILAYVVLSIKGDVATIVDIFSIPRRNAVQSIIKKIKADLLLMNISGLQVWMPRHHFNTEYLIQMGFEVKEEPLGITPVCRSFDPSLEFEYAKQNIYYTMADGDLF